MESFREHSEGCSALLWSAKTQIWHCGGSLGLFYSLDATREGEQRCFESSELAGESPITALALSGTEESVLAVGCGESVSLWSYPSLGAATQSLIARRNLAVTSLQFTASGQNLIVASRDPNLVCYNVSEKEEYTLLNSEALGIRTLALSPRETRLAFVNENGAVCVYGLRKKQRTGGEEELEMGRLESHSVGVISHATVREPARVGYSLLWFDEERLLVPSTNGSILVLSSDSSASSSVASWSESFLLGDSLSGVKHAAVDVNLLALSPNRSFLVSADVEGSLLLWRVNSERLEKSVPLRALSLSFSLTQPLVDIAWGQRERDNTIWLLSGDSWAVVSEVVEESEGSPSLPVSASASIPSATHTEKVAETEKAEEVSDEQFLALAQTLDAEDGPFTQSQTAPAGMDVSHTAPTQLYSPVASPAKATTTKDKKKEKEKSSLRKKRRADEDDDDEELLFEDPPSKKANNNKEQTSENKTLTSPAAEKKAPAAVKALFDDEADDNSVLEEKEMEKNSRDVANARSALFEEEDYVEGEEDGDGDPLSRNYKRLAGAYPSLSLAKTQSAFQPTATKPDDKNRRYLCWNHVGNVTLREDAIENRIEVRFADTSVHKNEAFADRSGYVMGALSDQGVAFATEAEDLPPSSLSAAGGVLTLSLAEREEQELRRQQVKGSTIVYHAFASMSTSVQGTNESFRVTLSGGEAVLCIAAGKGFIAVATSKRLLRVFTSSGVEVSTSSLKGEIVCLAAMESLLAVVYQHSVVVQREAEKDSVLAASLAVDLLEIHWQTGCRSGPVHVQDLPMPLPPTATLTWIGFDVDAHQLLTLDSEGTLTQLVQTFGWQWLPVLRVSEVRKTIDHKFWPIAVKHSKLMYVLLNGESRPAVYPQPVVSMKPLRLSLATIRDGVAMKEDAREKAHSVVWNDTRAWHAEQQLLARQNDVAQAPVLAAALSEATQALEERVESERRGADRQALIEFQDAIKAQQIARAVTFALRLREEISLEAAIKVANHHGRASVARSLAQILDHRRQIESLAAQAQQEALMLELQASQQDFGHSSTQEYEAMQEREPEPMGVLSRKASFAQQSSSSSKANAAPSFSSRPAEEETAKPKKTLNPFAVGAKRKAGEEATPSQQFKATPSPKKPSLNRTSTFSQNARQHRLNDKSIL